MPQFLSPEAQSLLRMLFKRNPSNRLGWFIYLDLGNKSSWVDYLKEVVARDSQALDGQ